MIDSPTSSLLWYIWFFLGNDSCILLFCIHSGIKSQDTRFYLQ